MISPDFLAGFIDGEGYVALARNRRVGRSLEYAPRVVVYNSSLEILDKIRRTWGGVLSDDGQRHADWKRGYALIWTNARAAALLTVIAPSLRVKSRQAAILLRYIARLGQTPRVRDSRGRLLAFPEREIRIREIFYDWIRILNERGARSMERRVLGSSRRLRTGKTRGPPSAQYLAGFVDAEGSVMITRTFQGKYRRACYGARVCVSNTKLSVLEEIHRTYGGILEDQPPKVLGWKFAYQLIWIGERAEGVLSKVAPFLVVKRPQATVMAEFLAHLRATRRAKVGSRATPLPREVMVARESFYRRMKELNAKGPPAGPSTHS